MFIVKNETFTGLILMAWLLVPPCPPNALYWAFDLICQQRVLAPWLLLKQDILSEARVY